MSYTFYADEREDHRIELGIYAGQRKHISGKDKDLTQFPLAAYMTTSCDNINLVEHDKGMFCQLCSCYHALFTLKGIKAVDQPIPQRGAEIPNRTFVNPGKYRSEWTSDDECFDDPYPSFSVQVMTRTRINK